MELWGDECRHMMCWEMDGTNGGSVRLYGGGDGTNLDGVLFIKYTLFFSAWCGAFYCKTGGRETHSQTAVVLLHRKKKVSRHPQTISLTVANLMADLSYWQ